MACAVRSHVSDLRNFGWPSDGVATARNGACCECCDLITQEQGTKIECPLVNSSALRSCGTTQNYCAVLFVSELLVVTAQPMNGVLKARWRVWSKALHQTPKHQLRIAAQI